MWDDSFIQHVFIECLLCDNIFLGARYYTATYKETKTPVLPELILMCLNLRMTLLTELYIIQILITNYYFFFVEYSNFCWDVRFVSILLLHLAFMFYFCPWEFACDSEPVTFSAFFLIYCFLSLTFPYLLGLVNILK